MENKKVSRKLIMKRRRIATAIYRSFALIGLPMSVIGTGGDYGEMIPSLYFTGISMCLIALFLKYILEETK